MFIVMNRDEFVASVTNIETALAHKLRDPKFYTARTKRAVNSGGVL